MHGWLPHGSALSCRGSSLAFLASRLFCFRKLLPAVDQFLFEKRAAPLEMVANGRIKLQLKMQAEGTSGREHLSVSTVNTLCPPSFTLFPKFGASESSCLSDGYTRQDSLRSSAGIRGFRERRGPCKRRCLHRRGLFEAHVSEKNKKDLGCQQPRAFNRPHARNRWRPRRLARLHAMLQWSDSARWF